MIFNVLTLVACLVMLLVFRRFDKTNLKMAKLRRYTSKIFDDFKKLAETEGRKFNDATIEMDILIKKSQTLSTNIQGSIKDIETRLKGLDIEKTNLKKVEEDLKVISQSARSVNKQIEFIADAREHFEELSKNIHVLSETVETLKSDNASQMQVFSSRLRERSREIIQEFTDQVNQMRKMVIEKEEVLTQQSEEKVGELSRNFNDAVERMEQKLIDSSDVIMENFKSRLDAVAKSIDGAANLQNQLELLRINMNDLEGSLFDKIKERSEVLDAEINNSANKLFEKLNSVDERIDESKDKLIKTFKDEVERVRTEMDNLNIHSIAKRDEIVQASRKEAEEVRRRIETFEEKYDEFENKLQVAAADKVEAMNEEYRSLEQKFNGILERMNSREEQLDSFLTSQGERMKRDFASLEMRLADVKNEIVAYEEQNKIFSRTDTMIEKVGTAINDLNRMLAESQSEIKNMEKFFDDVEKIKDLRKNYDREIREYQGKKEALINIENEVKNLLEVHDFAVDKFNSLHEQTAKIDIVNARIDAMTVSYADLENKIRELHEYEEMITKNLESATKSDIIISTIDSRISAFQKTMERSDKRIEKLNKDLKSIEENTLILKSRENEIKEVRDKFGELESLATHLEERIKQVNAMFRKMESLREEIETTDQKVQDMYFETDKRMRQFADFIQAVDNASPILKQVKGNAAPARNVNESMIKTIRELSGKGWSSEEISKKLLLDENSVRFIINTTSL